ncbi:hypothetical protein V6Z12_A01G087500 [Gossypium hirsutum]
MGFRDLSKFNIALLAKQGWRIMENPSSLIAHVLKAKYFNGSNIMEAPLGTNASLIWKKKVVGLNWVSDLILLNLNRWHRDIIYSNFAKEEADKIVSIPIPTTRQLDKVVWFNDKSGTYSVKSGYKILLNQSNVNVNEKKQFKQIWSLTCPSKVHILIRLICNDRCPRYRQFCKSSIHAVRDCMTPAQVWSNNRKEEIAIAIWALWFSRNRYAYENKLQSAEKLVTFITGFALEHRDCALILKHPKPRSIVVWMPPPQGWVKINVDAGIFAVNNRAVLRFIIRNDEGFVMGLGFKGHNLVHSVVIAEAIAVLHRLQFVLDMGFSKVVLESNSKLVVQNIQKRNEDYSETRPFTWDVQNLARNFSSCQLQFIAREGNKAAHAMTAEGLRADEDLLWVEDAPSKAMEAVDSDQ